MQNALSRRVKRRVFGPPHTCYVDHAPGCGEAALAEAEALAADLIAPTKRSIVVDRPGGLLVLRDCEYHSVLEMCVRAQVISDIRMIIHQERVPGVADLAAALARVPVDLYFPEGARVRLWVASIASGVYHEGLIAEAARREMKGVQVASPGDPAAHHKISISMLHDTLRVSISLPGEPLWKRGYRTQFGAAAPLREDLAQVAVRGSYPGPVSPSIRTDEPPFVLVPFAGTGTLAVETAIYAFGIPSAFFGRRYAFDEFRFSVPKSVDYVLRQLDKRVLLAARSGPHAGPLRALLIDNDEEAVAQARSTLSNFAAVLERRGLPPLLQATISHADAFALKWAELAPNGADVFLPLNPPYGRRLRSGDPVEVYQRIAGEIEGLAQGRRLFGTCLCPSAEIWRAIRSAAESAGLAHRTHHVGQGGLDLRLLFFSPRG